MKNVESIDLSGWNTSELVEWGFLFAHCTNLKEVNLSGWDTSSLIQVDNLFLNCLQLKKIIYSSTCENNLILELLDSNLEAWLWYQDGKGPYIPSEIPSLSQGKVATLTKFEEVTTPPVEDKDDNSKPTSSVDPDSYTPTPTGDSSTVVVDLSIKNNKALEGIITENGELPEEELRILETYLNTTPNYNPNDYYATIVNAFVSKNKDNNEKYNFELTVAITLKEESRINFVINKLEKKMKSKDTMVNASGLIILSLEEAETTPSYSVKEVGDKIIIEGLLVKDAFGSDNQIDESFIKGILDDEGYDVSDLDFKSTQNKNSTFILHDLTSLISIELVSTDQTTSASNSSTRPSNNSSSSKPHRYPINKPGTSSTAKKTLYRIFNTLTGEHFFTSNESEKNELLKDSRWKDEGHSWTAPEISSFPIYRLVNPNNGDHHYTMDKNEYDTLATYGWQQEGIGLYSADSNNEDIVQLHRLYNPNAKDAGSHHYTPSEEERDNLIKQGWQYEGIAWYGLK